MKVYEIIDGEEKSSVGALLYYEKTKDFIIELSESLGEWDAPLLFSGLVKKGIYTVGRELSLLWVKERIIPPGRQNIGSILTNHRLKAYDEMKFLELSSGKCSQDSLFIKPSGALPEYVQKRQERNLTECVMNGQGYMLCFFADGIMKKVELSNLSGVPGIDRVVSNERLFSSGRIMSGGYGVTFNDSIDVPASVLYEKGSAIPLTLTDFLVFSRDNLLDTTESCTLIECTRQNLAYLSAYKGLMPVKADAKGSLYLKGELLRVSENWEA